MPESVSPSVRIHRVTTRRRNLRALQCPLESELLVAEFAGELPPDVALAVREHVAVCEICGARSRALQAPYQLLASLGSEPVPYVPDLRDSVRAQARKGRFYWGVVRVAGNFGRGGAITLVGVVAVALIIALIAGGIFFSANAQQASRSSNTVQGAPAAASGGELFAETNKLVTITDSSGNQWQVAEIIAVSEHTGAVDQSLPASSAGLSIAQSKQMPVGVAITPLGGTAYEVTAPDDNGKQALVAIHAATGEVRFITPLSLPVGQSADSLVLSPDGLTAYIGLSMRAPADGGPRILVFDAQTGALQNTFSPDYTAQKIPLPPPAGGLPASVFPNSVPTLDATSLKVSVGAGGELAVSPDRRWIYDVLILSNGGKHDYAVVRRINAFTGDTDQELALPGDFTIARLTVDGSTDSPQIYLVKGSPDAECFVLDATATGPTELGDILLGGPPAAPHSTFSGYLSVSPSADGAQLYITQNASTAGGAITGQDLWLLDTANMNVTAHTANTGAADGALINGAGGSNAPTFILRGGQIYLINNDLSGTPTAWLSLANGQVVQLLATAG